MHFERVFCFFRWGVQLLQDFREPRNHPIFCCLVFLVFLDIILEKFWCVFVDVFWWTWIWRKSGSVIQCFCWWKNPANHPGYKKPVVNHGIIYQPQLVKPPDFWTVNSSSQGGDSFYFGWRSLEDFLEHRVLDRGTWESSHAGRWNTINVVIVGWAPVYERSFMFVSW